jgi:hypothetical protein
MNLKLGVYEPVIFFCSGTLSTSVVDPNSFFSYSDSDPINFFFGFGYGIGFLD